jgi:hypothetical protein
MQKIEFYDTFIKYLFYFFEPFAERLASKFAKSAIKMKKLLLQKIFIALLMPKQNFVRIFFRDPISTFCQNFWKKNLHLTSQNNEKTLF